MNGTLIYLAHVPIDLLLIGNRGALWMLEMEMVHGARVQLMWVDYVGWGCWEKKKNIFVNENMLMVTENWFHKLSWMNNLITWFLEGQKTNAAMWFGMQKCGAFGTQKTNALFVNKLSRLLKFLSSYALLHGNDDYYTRVRNVITFSYQMGT